MAARPQCGRVVGDSGRQHVTQIYTLVGAGLYGRCLGFVIFGGKIGNGRWHNTHWDCVLAVFVGRAITARLCLFARAPASHDMAGHQALYHRRLAWHRHPQRVFLLCGGACAGRRSGHHRNAGAHFDLWIGPTDAVRNIFSHQTDWHHAWHCIDIFTCGPKKQPAGKRLFDLGVARMFQFTLLRHRKYLPSQTWH